MSFVFWDVRKLIDCRTDIADSRPTLIQHCVSWWFNRAPNIIMLIAHYYPAGLKSVSHQHLQLYFTRGRINLYGTITLMLTMQLITINLLTAPFTDYYFSSDTGKTHISYGVIQVNRYSAKLIYFNFQSLEVVDRGSDPQPRVVDKYSYLLNLR